MSSAGNPLDPNAVERAVEMVRDAVRASEIYGQQLAAIGNEHGKLLCTAATRAAALERELARARRLQPLDQDGQPITQAAANRLMSTYYSDVPQLRTERDAALARAEEVERERDQLRAERDQTLVALDHANRWIAAAEKDVHALRTRLAAAEGALRRIDLGPSDAHVMRMAARAALAPSTGEPKLRKYSIEDDVEFVRALGTGEPDPLDALERLKYEMQDRMSGVTAPMLGRTGERQEGE